jgi:hypothetical protein
MHMKVCTMTNLITSKPCYRIYNFLVSINFTLSIYNFLVLELMGQSKKKVQLRINGSTFAVEGSSKDSYITGDNLRDQFSWQIGI